MSGSGKRNNRASMARQFFIELGYKPYQAAGIVGRLMQESGPGLDTGAVGDSGTAFGVAQVRGQRYENLKKMAAEWGTDPSDFQTQLRFVDWEMKNTEPFAYKQLMASEDVNGAAEAMMHFERPQGYTKANPKGGHGWANTLRYAMELAGEEAPAGGSMSGGAAIAKTGPSQKLGEIIAGLGVPSPAAQMLANTDFASLFKPPAPPPPLPELPPIPAAPPLASDVQQYPLPDFRHQPRHENPRDRALVATARRRTQYRGST